MEVLFSEHQINYFEDIFNPFCLSDYHLPIGQFYLATGQKEN